MQHLLANEGFRPATYDVTSHLHLSEPVDFVLHFAISASPIDHLRLPIETLKVGNIGLHALGLAREMGARLLLASTSETYGDPTVAGGAFPVLRKASAVGAAAFGGPMATYTAVLIANTAVPSWHAPHDELPFVFAGSAMAAGGGITMALTPVDEAGPSRKVALTGVAVELAAMHRVENGHGIVSEPYHEGKAGALLRAAKAATLSGAGITALLGRTRPGSVAGGVLLAVGSLLTRMGVFEAGMESARDPKYTVIPQRERLEARQAAVAEGDPHVAKSVVR